MKLIKSFSLPVLSVALLLPIAQTTAVTFDEAKLSMQHACKQVSDVGSRMINSVKVQYQQLPTAKTLFNELENAQMPGIQSIRSVAQKLGIEDNRGLKGALIDAKDAIVTYSARHPYVILAAVSTAAFGAGFWVARKLSRTKKNA